MVNRLADLRTILWVLIFISLMVVQWLELVNHWSLYGLTLYFAFACKVIIHHHIHLPTMRSPWNGVFSWLLAVSSLVNLQFVYALHVENHHQKHMTDEDTFGVKSFRGRWAIWEVLTCPGYFLTRFIWSGEARSIFQRWKGRCDWRRFELQLHSLSIYCLVTVLLVFNPINTLIYLMIPNFIGICLIIQTNHIQHIGCSDESEYSHSRTITSPIGNWLLFNGGYHLVHHLQPQFHWQDLPTFFYTEVSDKVPERIVHRTILGCLYALYVRSLFLPHDVYMEQVSDS